MQENYTTLPVDRIEAIKASVKRYHANKTRLKANARKRVRVSLPEIAKCGKCSSEFKPTQRRKYYCSLACVLEYRVQVATVVCPGCQANFVRQCGADQKYCSYECHRKVRFEKPKVDKPVTVATGVSVRKEKHRIHK